MQGFIGAGKVGTSLGVYFSEAGVDVRGYFSKSTESAENAAKLTQSAVYPDLESLINDNGIIWITTPDDAVETVAKQISQLKISDSKTFVHASGLLTSDALDSLRKKGHRVCSAHPLLAFSNISKAVEALKDTCFFIEGGKNELMEIKAVFRKTGNVFYEINKKDKPAYHAGAVVLSNYLVTLVHASGRLFELAGIKGHKFENAVSVLLYSVLDNLKDKAPKDALTGPIKRGDVETVKKHLEILEQYLPDLTELYKVLGRETLKLASASQKKETKDEWANLL